jgi:hypothetical protein
MAHKLISHTLSLALAAALLVSSAEARTVAPGSQTQEGGTPSEVSKSGRNTTEENKTKSSTTNTSGTKK